MEDILRRYTKRIKGFKDIEYSTRLKMLGIRSVEGRMLRSDLIEVFKMVKGFESLNCNEFFIVQQGSSTRGNYYKLFKKRCNSNIGANTFSNRVCNEWNKLPNCVVKTDSVLRFKIALDKYASLNGELM